MPYPVTYSDGYRLLQSFTTSGTAQGLQTTPITPAALAALTGVMSLDGADGARLIFAATTGATSITAWITGFEPILGPTGQPIAYVERVLSSTAAVALTMGTVATTVTLDATASTGNLGTCWSGAAAALLIIPTTALFVRTIGTLTGAMTPFVFSYSGGADTILGHVTVGGGGLTGTTPLVPPGVEGITHIRCLLSCATAANSVWCLAKRLQGNARISGY